MNVPDYSTTTEFMQWARENKRRADRLLAAIKQFSDVYNQATNELWVEIRNAAIDYEDKRG